MGMGYVHTSNIAQRLSSTILVLWYKEFERMEAQFITAERARNPVLHQWMVHREKMDSNSGFQPGQSFKDGKIKQARLHAGHFFTDDFHGAILEPPHHSRLTVAITAWHATLSKLRVRTARPCKRMVGASIPWTGIISIACLALQVLQQERVMRAFAWLLEAASGQMSVDDYNKLAELIGFARYALAMEKRTAAIMWEPLRAGFEKSRGPATKVEASTGRCGAPDSSQHMEHLAPYPSHEQHQHS